MIWNSAASSGSEDRACTTRILEYQHRIELRSSTLAANAAPRQSPAGPRIPRNRQPPPISRADHLPRSAPRTASKDQRNPAVSPAAPPLVAKAVESRGSAGPTGKIVELQSISAAAWRADRRSPKKRLRLRAANVLGRITPVCRQTNYWKNVQSRLRSVRSRGARMYSARRATNSLGASASALGVAVSLSAISSHPRSCASSAAA